MEEIKKRRILLVEDNEMNRDMLTRRLQNRGYQILSAENGLIGVQMASSEKPDLILMDMNLPIMDGLEATRRIKSDPATQSIPIIGLSAHARTEDREAGLVSGCDDYEPKPVELDRLLKKMEALLQASAKPSTG